MFSIVVLDVCALPQPVLEQGFQHRLARGMVVELEAGMPGRLLDTMGARPAWLGPLPPGEPALCLRLPAPVVDMMCTQALRRVWAHGLPAASARTLSTISIPWAKLQTRGVRPPDRDTAQRVEAPASTLTPQLCQEVADELRKTQAPSANLEATSRLHGMVAALQTYVDESNPLGIQRHLKTPCGPNTQAKGSSRYASDFIVRVLLMFGPWHAVLMI